MALVRLELRVGGMEGKEDVRILRGVLDAIEGIEAQDVKPGLVRLEIDPAAVSANRILAAIANSGDGYDVSLG